MNDDLKHLADSAAADQTAEAWRNHARVLTAYFAELLVGGMQRQEALALVVQAQEMMLHRVLWPDGGPD
jgi:hypothetical protein